jgi:hypothetical protein
VRRAATTLAFVAAATVAYGDAGSRQSAMEDLRDKADFFARKCGVRVDASIDWRSFAGKYKAAYDESSAGSLCGEVLDSLASICDEDEAAKAAVQHVRHLRCSYDGAVGRDIGLEVRGDTILARVSWDEVNTSDRVRAWIDNQPSSGGGGETTPSSSDGHLSVRQARERADVQPELDELAAGVRKACDVAIPISMDWASFEGHYRGGSEEHSAVGWCSQQVEQIGKMCKRNAEEKRTVAREVTSVACRWDANGGKEFKFSLGSGALVVGYTWDSGDSGDNLLRYLWNTLE